MPNALSAVNFCIKKPACLRYVISLTPHAIYTKANIVVLLVKIGYFQINFINFIVLSGTRLSESVYLQYDDTVFKKSSYTQKRTSSWLHGKRSFFVLLCLRSSVLQHPTIGELPVHPGLQVQEYRCIQPYSLQPGLSEPKEFFLSYHPG